MAILMPAPGGSGDNGLKEGVQVAPKLLLAHSLVASKQNAKAIGSIALIPTGQRQAAGGRIHRKNSCLIISKAVGTVRRLAGQITAQPVKNGHKIIADTAYTGLAEPGGRFSQYTSIKSGA